MTVAVSGAKALLNGADAFRRIFRLNRRRLSSIIARFRLQPRRNNEDTFDAAGARPHGVHRRRGDVYLEGLEGNHLLHQQPARDPGTLRQKGESPRCRDREKGWTGPRASGYGTGGGRRIPPAADATVSAIGGPAATACRAGSLAHRSTGSRAGAWGSAQRGLRPTSAAFASGTPESIPQATRLRRRVTRRIKEHT
jgi:hypothetical protein